MNCILRSHSEKDVYYEYSPNTPPLYEDVFGKCFRGVCRNISVSREVRIYEIKTKNRIPEYKLRDINALSHFKYSHTNIIPIIDLVVDFDEIKTSECQLFFIEEDVSGISLSDFLEGQINVSKNNAIKELNSMFQRDRVTFARKAIKEILQGLDFIHGRGLCLRYIDVKNIFITNDGNVRIEIKDCFLHDILLGYDDGLTSGRETLIRYLPICYCSPEIILMFDSLYVNYRSDIYSVGILFFHLLTGHIPYKGHYMEIISQHLNGKIPLCEIEDKQLRKIVKKATEKNPSKRYQFAYDFIHAIDKMDEDVVWYKKIWPFFSCL